MTQLIDNLFAVEVPEKASKFRAQRPHKTSSMCLYYKYGIEEQWNYIKLPPGTWSFLCTTRNATPEQAREITGEEYYPSIALAGLCKAKGLDERKNYVLLKKDLI